MPKVELYKQDGSKAGDFDLPEAIFGIEPNQHVLHDTVVMQQASRRQGTHSVKNRSAVRGGGRKPWRQKGTGRARQGSIRSPQWVGGGVVFGPTPRSYSFKMPKKVRRLAIRSALSARVLDNDTIVLESLVMDSPKTKEMAAVLTGLSAVNALIVTADVDDAVFLSARNLQGVSVCKASQLSVLDVLHHHKIVFTKDAVAKVEEVLG
ncbi:50S ribosomal protein L4 [Aureibacillus halotolerans]|uniref:Large ribosomal subunit protein uL4 n=1 Tax=Aureibacillus halotolerans TaxID=1508390 RepID=A0A4R6TR50_9BACI|nr:50S ribosomal protein L4 [Aureibacillus halotolerans]TDQ34710.1 LSU ribosomal protein L4P [Aureibacillus halotolerans]